MTVTATVITDSISNEGIRLTTLHLRYPRMIHSEFMTHRVFSRNGRSSRAVPVATLLKEDPYVPLFMKNQKGMQSFEHLTASELVQATEVWLDLVEYTKKAVERLNEIGVHKQWANRPLEWFGYIDVIVTSTDWANFFELRDEVGAQPEIDKLAKAIAHAVGASKPYLLIPGDWHMPYIRDEDIDLVSAYLVENETGLTVLEALKRVSVARCARLSYKPFDGNASIKAELERYHNLMISRPVHASPAEHVATPDSKKTVGTPSYGPITKWQNKKEWGNFYGWRQFRKMIPYNTVEDR